MSEGVNEMEWRCALFSSLPCDQAVVMPLHFASLSLCEIGSREHPSPRSLATTLPYFRPSVPAYSRNGVIHDSCINRLKIKLIIFF